MNANQIFLNALDAFDDGRWTQAFEMAAALSSQAPNHGGVHFLAGISALQMQRVEPALRYLQRASLCSPGRADYRAQYARALAMAQLLPAASAAADSAMKLTSDDPTTYDTLGVVYTKANLHRKAAEAFERAVRLLPTHANYRFNLGTSYLYYGELAAAEREYEQCLALAPDYWRAHLALAQLRRQSTSSNHVARLREMLARHGGNSEAGLYLHIALAKELEDLEEFPAAFEHYTLGKSIGRNAVGPSGGRDAAMFSAIRQCFEQAVDGEPGYGTEEPIFVMGMPRTGTTLVDRILSSHSSVHSAGELANFATAFRRIASASGHTSNEAIAGLPRAFAAWRELGQAYVHSTRPGTGHTPRFVDKLPHNFLYAGFIARALPGARLICLRRDPVDTCLSNFRQLFALEAREYDYSFDLLDTGRYFLQFDRLMGFWHEQLPGRVLEVRYEDLVDHQEDVTRQILEFCGLAWEAECLAFERNSAPVPTASASQVRVGMNRASVQRWRRYESQLVDLRHLLEPGLDGPAPA